MVAFELELRLLRAGALQPAYSLIHCTCLWARVVSPALESIGSQRRSLLARPRFIFLTIFLESNEQYEYINVPQPGGVLRVCSAGRGGRWMFSCGN